MAEPVRHTSVFESLAAPFCQCGIFSMQHDQLFLMVSHPQVGSNNGYARKKSFLQLRHVLHTTPLHSSEHRLHIVCQWKESYRTWSRAVTAMLINGIVCICGFPLGCHSHSAAIAIAKALVGSTTTCFAGVLMGRLSRHTWNTGGCGSKQKQLVSSCMHGCGAVTQKEAMTCTLVWQGPHLPGCSHLLHMNGLVKSAIS